MSWSGYNVPRYIEEENDGIMEWGDLSGEMVMPESPMYGPSIAPVYGGGSGLGSVDVIIGSDRDPIAQFGTDAAKVMMETVKYVPADKRVDTLKGWLASIDPSLVGLAEKHADAARKAGKSPIDALETGVRIAMANGFIHGAVEAGKGNMAPLQGLGLDACSGCAGCGTCSGCAGCDGTQSLGSLLGSIVGGVKSAGSWVADKAGDAKDIVQEGINKVASLACKAANNTITKSVASVGAIAGGSAGTTAAKGVDMIASACSPAPKQTTIKATVRPVMPYGIPQASSGGLGKYILPALGIGAVAFLVLRKRK